MAALFLSVILFTARDCRAEMLSRINESFWYEERGLVSREQSIEVRRRILQEYLACLENERVWQAFRDAWEILHY